MALFEIYKLKMGKWMSLLYETSGLDVIMETKRVDLILSSDL